MERLTKKYGNEYGIKPLDDKCHACASCLKCERHLNQITQKLGEYENTGLEPKDLEVLYTCFKKRNPRYTRRLFIS